MTPAEAYRVIDEEASATASVETIRRIIFQERVQIGELKKVYYAQALTGDRGAVEAYCHLSLRLSQLLGLDAVKATAHLHAIASAPTTLDSRSAQRLLEQFDRLIAPEPAGDSDGEPIPKPSESE
jgi:hypothetical protein